MTTRVEKARKLAAGPRRRELTARSGCRIAGLSQSLPAKTPADSSSGTLA
jgi:hypothetical protein